MIGVTIEPGKKICMGILLQYPVALPCKPFIVNPFIPCKHPVLSLSEIIPVGDSIGRDSEYHGYIPVWNLCEKFHAVHAINPVIQFFCCHSFLSPISEGLVVISLYRRSERSNLSLNGIIVLP